MKYNTPVEKESRFAERILQRELDAITRHITKRNKKSNCTKSRKEFERQKEILTKKAEELKNDLHFLKTYRSYLKRESEFPGDFI